MWSEGVFWSLFHFSVAAHRQAYHGMYDDRGVVEAESERLTEEAFGSHSTSFSYNLTALLPASLNHSISTQQHFSLLELHSHLPLDLLRDNLLLRISTHS